MEKTLRLIDAVCEAYDLYHVSKDGATFCNMAVHHVCARMGYDKFKGLLANQIVDFLRRSPEWTPVPLSGAQELANEGRLVVAGAEDHPHGHVVVVRPGAEDFSGKWESKAPKVSQVGATSYIGRSMAWAFQEIPEIWVLNETA